MKSSVLIIGHPQSETVSFGADFCATDLEALEKLALPGAYLTIVIHVTPPVVQNPEELLIRLKNTCALSQIIFIHDGRSPQLFTQLLEVPVYKILEDHAEPQLSYAVQLALEEAQLLHQNQQLMKMIWQQNESLNALRLILEDRVQTRENQLRKAHRNLVETNKKTESLHRALVAIHRSTSIGEMERLVTDALAPSLHLKWVRINPTGQNAFDALTERSKQNFSIYSIKLQRDSIPLGHIIFGRGPQQKYLKSERQFLEQVAESVSLSIDRLVTLRQIEEIEQQWEATFNAITVPVSLVDQEYNLHRVNQSYTNQAQGTYSRGEKCYKVLFNRNVPCENCVLGQSFQLRGESSSHSSPPIVQVQSTPLTENKEEKIYVNFYRDISSQLHLEHKLMETAKMAELGTIGGSIAHEINNPLAGILTFLQLIKSDLHGNESYAQDILEMERAALKCKTIIENLLSFSRQSHDSRQEKSDFIAVIKQALQIVELQWKSSAIKISAKIPNEKFYVPGAFGLLAQSIMTLLQMTFETLSQQLEKDPSKNPEIQIRAEKTEKMIVLKLTSDGDPEARGLTQIFRQTIAEQILTDLGGRVDFITDLKSQNTVKISLPRIGPAST
ncbi:MAG: sensor histidine kinase [Bdellovibrionales bacterium]